MNGKREQDESGPKEITPADRVRAAHAKREQDESGPKEITPADRVRAADERAQALEQKSRVEEGGIPNEPVSEHSVDSDGNRSSAFEEFPARQRIAIRGFALAVGVWIIVEVLVFGTILEPHFSGRNVSFEESPITFLFALGMGFVIVGWSISPLLRAVMSKITGIPSEPVPAHPVDEPPTPRPEHAGPKEITPADTFGPVPAKHVMKKFGVFVTSLVAAIIVFAVYGIVSTVFLRAFPNIGMPGLIIALILMVGLMIAAALLTYRALNKKIEQSRNAPIMSNLDCPHCGKRGISVMRKMFLGPALPATCKACGKKVGVPYIAMLAVIPFLVGIVGSAFVEPFALKAALWVGGGVVMGVCHMRWVPLEPR